MSRHANTIKCADRAPLSSTCARARGAAPGTNGPGWRAPHPSPRPETWPNSVQHALVVAKIVVDLVHGFYDGELPDLDCIDENRSDEKRGIYRDGGHLSRSSGAEHLVGYAYFGMLYGKSPALLEEYKPGDVPPKLDRRMREAAWRVICTMP